MSLLSDFKKSRTIRLAWANKLLGVISVILLNMGYFKEYLTPEVFGVYLIVLGIVENYLRQVTRKALEDK